MARQTAQPKERHWKRYGPVDTTVSENSSAACYSRYEDSVAYVEAHLLTCLVDPCRLAPSSRRVLVSKGKGTVRMRLNDLHSAIVT
jgi:hypothetical protein